MGTHSFVAAKRELMRVGVKVYMDFILPKDLKYW